MSQPPERSSTLHICYVHGWQGDHTSFQAFPTDFHNYLSPRLPASVDLNTHIYPTYKALRPIKEATEKLLKWLETLSEGRIILVGHSLGGFLTADAAVGGQPSAVLGRRIIGMIAFDTPYLGIHPHVVISGLASILPAYGPKESDVNDQNKVNIVDPAESSTFIASRPDLPPADEQHTLLHRVKKFWTKHGDNPIKFTAKYLTELLQFSSCVVDRQGLSDRYLALEKWGDPAKTANPGDWIHFFTITAPKNEGEELSAPSQTSAPSYSSSYVFHPPRHSASQEAPAMVGDIGVEIVPYGTDRIREQTPAIGSTSEFDRFAETALKEKADWQAKRAAKAAARRSAEERGHSHPHISAFTHSILRTARSRSNLSVDAALQKSETTSLSSVGSDVSEDERSSPPRDSGPPSGKEKRHRRAPQHFIVLPWVMGYRWQGIPIGGVEDEVEAHTGIFFRNKNFEYDSVVERTANFALEVVK